MWAEVGVLGLELEYRAAQLLGEPAVLLDVLGTEQAPHALTREAIHLPVQCALGCGCLHGSLRDATTEEHDGTELLARGLLGELDQQLQLLPVVGSFYCLAFSLGHGRPAHHTCSPPRLPVCVDKAGARSAKPFYIFGHCVELCGPKRRSNVSPTRLLLSY